MSKRKNDNSNFKWFESQIKELFGPAGVEWYKEDYPNSRVFMRVNTNKCTFDTLEKLSVIFSSKRINWEGSRNVSGTDTTPDLWVDEWMDIEQ